MTQRWLESNRWKTDNIFETVVLTKNCLPKPLSEQEGPCLTVVPWVCAWKTTFLFGSQDSEWRGAPLDVQIGEKYQKAAKQLFWRGRTADVLMFSNSFCSSPRRMIHPDSLTFDLQCHLWEELIYPFYWLLGVAKELALFNVPWPSGSFGRHFTVWLFLCFPMPWT